MNNNVTKQEIYNANRIPWREMSENAQSILSVHWKSVEWYNRDACAWVPNTVCPRQWNKEAYRILESVIKNKTDEPNKNYDLVMRFESEAARDNYCGWMCDGGGECQLIDSFEYADTKTEIVRLQYCPEDLNYPANDAKRYGKFMTNLDEYGRPMIVIQETIKE